jgi:CRISPR/Cas system-associated exonuclease Cas4 (RecB family)
MFGSAIHKAMERYYSDIMNGKPPAELAVLRNLFAEHLEARIDACTLPIIYKKDTPDKSGALALGNLMLEHVYPKLPPPTGNIVAGIEVLLAAPLVDSQGNPIDMMLTGIVDLVLLDPEMHPIVVDFKTAKQAKAQAAADEDLQMSVYAYLMEANNYTDLDKPLECRFQVMRKLKTPKLETITTTRTKTHRARLVKILNAVLAGIENQVFIPNKGWLCGDCAYKDACQTWCFFFQDVSHSRDKGIVILCAFQCTVSHTFAEIKQFCVKSKAFTCPTVNVFYGIMVSELICSSMRVVIFIPQFPEVCLYPCSCMESVTPSREKISPVRVQPSYCCIIYF